MTIREETLSRLKKKKVITKKQRKQISKTLKSFFAANPDKKPWGNKGNTGKKFSEEHKKKISEGIKAYHKSNPEEFFRIRSEANKGKVPWNKGLTTPDDVRKKISESNIRHLREHPEDRRWTPIRKGAKQTPEARRKISDGVKKAILEGRMNNALPGRFIKGYFYSKKNKKKFHYRSGYELFAYKLLEQMIMVESYEVEPLAIKYFNGYDHVSWYIPDILVTYKGCEKQLIEVRPTKYLDDIRSRRKFKAARRYCKAKGMTFAIWTEKQVFKHKIQKHPLVLH
jgi:hypothetical protein